MICCPATTGDQLQLLHHSAAPCTAE